MRRIKKLREEARELFAKAETIDDAACRLRFVLRALELETEADVLERQHSG
jgi:hypothetical protein